LQFAIRILHSSRSHRRGLAPLELVVALPMLLGVMAMFVYFGNSAYWKVRTSVAARHVAWSHRFPRTGRLEPPPRPFPVNGSLANQADDELAMLDDPALQHPVARGPLPPFIVREQLLDPGRGARQGVAHVKLEPAMLPKMGPYKYNLEHPLLDDKFQYPQMGIPANRYRRIPFIYVLPKADASLSGAYAESVHAVLNAPLRRQLSPLDRDEELRAFYGRYRYYYADLASFCSLSRSEVESSRVDPLVDRIERIPERLTRDFLRMYRAQLAALEAEQSQLQSQLLAAQAPGSEVPAEEIAAMQIRLGQVQQAITALEPRIQVLQSFLDRLMQMG
jgi:hypothetical protein